MSKELESIAPAPTEEEISAVQNEVVEVEEVKEEVKEAPKEDAPVKPPEGFVPHQALHAEREQRKKIQAQLAEIQRESATRTQQMEARLQQLQQAWQQQNQPKPPEYDTDPLGNLKFTAEQTQQELAQLREWRAQQERDYYERVQREQYANQVASAVTQAESEYVQENPDYLEAVSHLKSLRANQLQALGMPENQIVAYVQNEAFQIAEAALRQGQNPADVAFRMAKASGWVKKEVKPDAEVKMETLQKGVKASASLGSGGAQPGKLTIEALALMSDSEFNEALKSGAWEKLGFN